MDDKKALGCGSGFCTPVFGAESDIQKFRELGLPMIVNFGNGEGFKALTSGMGEIPPAPEGCGSGFCTPIMGS